MPTTSLDELRSAVEDLERAFAVLMERGVKPPSLARANSEGNPNHKGSGPGGGQFTSGGGSGGGGSATHGKHHARRERRKRKLAALRKRYKREGAQLKREHRADRKDVLARHGKERASLHKEHAKERKEYAKSDAADRKSLAKDHAAAHKDVDRKHAAAHKQHEKGAAKEHAEIDRQRAAKEGRIAKGERKARNTDKRHAREHAENEKSIAKIDETVAMGHRNELANAKKKGASQHELDKISERHAKEREQAKSFPEKRRQRLAERHKAEREKADKFLEKSPGLRERLDKQTAAKHEHVEKRPERLEAKRQKAHGKLDKRQARERKEQKQEHRESRADLRKEHKEARQSQREEHREDRESTRESQRDERKELVGRLKDELAEHGFKRKGAKGGERTKPERNAGPDSLLRRSEQSAGPVSERNSRDLEVSERGSPEGASRRLSPHRTLKASSAESIVRYVLRQRGWTAAFRRGELTDAEKLQLLSDVREYARGWMRHEAEVLFRTHGREVDASQRSLGSQDLGTAQRSGSEVDGASKTHEVCPSASAEASDANGDVVRRGIGSDPAPMVSPGDGSSAVHPGGLSEGGEVDGPHGDPVRAPSRRIDGVLVATGLDGIPLELSRALSTALSHHVRRFFARAKQFVREAIVAGAMILGGPEPLGADDLIEAERQAHVQAEYLDRFERDAHFRTPAEIAEGETPIEPMSAAQFVARAEMFGSNAPWAGNINWDRRRRIKSGRFNQERRVHSIPLDRHHACPTCKRESDKGWVTIGSLEDIGSPGCECLGINCDCHFTYRNVA